MQSTSKDKISKESACAPPKAAPIQAQSRRILVKKKKKKKIVIKAIRVEDIAERDGYMAKCL